MLFEANRVFFCCTACPCDCFLLPPYLLFPFYSGQSGVLQILDPVAVNIKGNSRSCRITKMLVQVVNLLVLSLVYSSSSLVLC